MDRCVSRGRGGMGGAEASTALLRRLSTSATSSRSRPLSLLDKSPSVTRRSVVPSSTLPSYFPLLNSYSRPCTIFPSTSLTPSSSSHRTLRSGFSDFDNNNHCRSRSIPLFQQPLPFRRRDLVSQPNRNLSTTSTTST